MYPVYFTAAGFFFIILGIIIGWYILPPLELYLISKSISLIESNDILTLWEVAPYPLKFKVYLFNVSNPDEVQNGSRPQLTEVGPYIYDEFIPKTILNHSEEDDTVAYTQRRMFSFNQQDSGNYSEDDVLTVINFGLLGILMEFEDFSPMLFMDSLNLAVASMYPGITNPFITAKVKDILFDGIPMKCEAKNTKFICSVIRSKNPPINRRIDAKKRIINSMFYHMNNTEDGPFIMRRGSKNARRGEIISYRNQNNFEIWGKGPCNTMKGTDLTVMPQISEPLKGVDFFSALLCRSLHAELSGELYYEGLHAFTFSVRKAFGSKSPLESCYCNTKNCPPYGTYEGGACYQTPIIISKPHFYQGAKSLLEYAEGLEPDRVKHTTVISVEPRTATPISTKFRIQVNIRLRRISSVKLLENVSEGIFPILWFEESNDIPDDIKGPLVEGLLQLDQFENVKWIFVGLGIFIMIIGCSIDSLKTRKKKKAVVQTEKEKEIEKMTVNVSHGDFYEEKVQIIRI